MTSKVEKALAAKNLRFIGGFRTRKNSARTSSKHEPHQGSAEKARRLKQRSKPQ
ncbi:hypothetical protein K1W69_17315 [Hoeflea sp. WL0058]|uniref:Uncharacterized protein n=1 Tax=Flavimaribacter sediminis TaxID=2865987 RepID=A0AAE2ZLC9_9HYPH|nr:hypothetical protein [Flavimaribacter sediminis]MBW8638959.1 hypothetical protein [Flavimaribacter sediminis]